MIWEFLLFVIVLVYMVYGIRSTVKNKNLTHLHKAIWIAVIILIPVIGVSTYLRTMFLPRAKKHLFYHVK